MSTLNTLLTLWLTAAWVMAGGWAWQRRKRNAGIVDALWAAGLAVAAVFAALVGQGAASSRWWVAILGGVWGTRLALHLWRRVRSEPEDGRYRQLRAHWLGHQGKFFAFFQFQAFLVGVCSVPFIAVAANAEGPGVWIVPALTTWVVSVAGEALADRQLARFRADPTHHGKTCRDGLWRYSRHPNYFFEWLHWFTYVFLAVGSPIGWLAWVGPVLMFLFVRYVSGVPLTEAQAVRTRGDDYRRYQRDTPTLIPWFPRHTGEDV